VAIISILTLTSCASSQVNYNTLDIASTYDQLITKQVTFNLRKTYENPYGIPAFVKVSNQTATTQNSITPTFTLPLTDQITTALNGVGALTSRTSQFTGKSLSLSAVDQWNQTYTLSPIVDPDQLRRLQTLYQYVTKTIPPFAGRDADYVFESTYPIIETSGSAQSNKSPDITITITGAGKPVTVKPTREMSNGPPKTQYVRRSIVFDENGNVVVQNGRITFTWIPANPDITFVKQPGCILCDYGAILKDPEKSAIADYATNKAKYDGAHELVKNVVLKNDWLYAPNEAQGGPGAVPLPSSEFATLYVNSDRLKYFYEFVLFTQEAASQGTGSPTSGGQSEGRKNPPPQNINIPVGGINQPVP
jgi:hypothetical protein